MKKKIKTVNNLIRTFCQRCKKIITTQATNGNNRLFCSICKEIIKKEKGQKRYNYIAVDRSKPKQSSSPCLNPECNKYFLIQPDEFSSRLKYCPACRSNNVAEKARKEKYRQKEKENIALAQEKIELKLDKKFKLNYKIKHKERPKYYIVCKYCRTTFLWPKEERKGKANPFCNLECQGAYNKKYNDILSKIRRVKNCWKCNRKFLDTTKENQRNFCDWKAEYKTCKDDRNEINYEICENRFCNIKFKKRQNNQKFCSRKCNLIANQETFKPKNCTICQNELSFNELKDKQIIHSHCLKNKLENDIKKLDVDYKDIEENYSFENYFNDLQQIPLFSESWWGRLGEYLFHSIYRKSYDFNAEKKNNKYDFYHSKYGTINVKTSCANFQEKWGILVNSDKTIENDTTYIFVICFNDIREKIQRAYMIPKLTFSDRISIASNDSKFDHFKVSNEIVKEINKNYNFILDKLAIDIDEIIENATNRVRGLHCEELFKSMYPEAQYRLKTVGRNHIYDFDHIEWGRVDVKKGHFSKYSKKYSFTKLAEDKSFYDYVFAFVMDEDLIKDIFLIPSLHFSSLLSEEEINQFKMSNQYNLEELNLKLKAIQTEEGLSVKMQNYTIANNFYKELGLTSNNESTYFRAIEYNEKKKGWHFKCYSAIGYDKIFCVGLLNGKVNKAWLIPLKQDSVINFILNENSIENQINFEG